MNHGYAVKRSRSQTLSVIDIGLHLLAHTAALSTGRPGYKFQVIKR